VGRLEGNSPPLQGKPLETGGVAILLGKEGATIMDEGELATLHDVLDSYAASTGNDAPKCILRGSPNTEAWQRASYGNNASVLAGQIAIHTASQQSK
jgi:hypothetical protein